MAKKSFIKNTAIMLFATSLTNVFNLLLQLFMVRELIPADFGLLEKLMGLSIITTLPTGTFQAVITKFISSYKGENNLVKIRNFLRLFLKKMGLFGVFILCLFTIYSKDIAVYYKTQSSGLIPLLGVLLLINAVLPLNLGGLQGLQKFKSLGSVSIINSLLRLILSVIFVKIGLSVGGAITALIIAGLVAFIISFMSLRKYFFWKDKLVLKECKNDLNIKSIYKYCFPAFVGLFSFALLTNMDVQLISPFFSVEEVGFFAVARIVGKIILYLPCAVIMVMFPRISEQHAQNKDTTFILKSSLIIVGLMCLSAGTVCVLFPAQILKILTGAVYPECIPLVSLFVISMSCYSLSSVFLYYYLSVHNMKFIYLFVVFVVLQGVLIRLFHGSLVEVLYIMAGCSVVLFLINLLSLRIVPKILECQKID